ncbi:MarR family transcriptional regulator, partial [Arthrobacter deserti]|nr:MarR family transcriptional regulator [Arthrobacter deserti]
RNEALSVPGVMLERLGLDRRGLGALNSSMRELIRASQHALAAD